MAISEWDSAPQEHRAYQSPIANAIDNGCPTHSRFSNEWPGWSAHPFLHYSGQGRVQLAMGNGRERKEPPSTFSGLERVALSVLRILVAGRQLLLFPGRLGEHSGDLGPARAPHHLWQNGFGPFASDIRAAAFHAA